MKEEKPETGRRYRQHVNSEIIVRDWESFKASWKSTDFIKNWNDLSDDNIRQ